MWTAAGFLLYTVVATNRTTRLGSTVATVGFPNVGLQGFAPKLAKGEIAALCGVQDDAKYFQIGHHAPWHLHSCQVRSGPLTYAP